MQANDKKAPRPGLAWLAVINQLARGKRLRPGYIFEEHKHLVVEFFGILDRAAINYDLDEEVADDYRQYIKDWEQERAR